LTAQRPEDFINLHPEFDSEGYKLFHVVDYKLKSKIEKTEKLVCSALWRGYIATYTLKEDGSLFLTKLSYPEIFDGSHINAREKEVLEKIEGNFFIEFRASFFGKRFKVPFNNGIIDLNKSNWIYEDEINLRKILNGNSANKKT
jgi:hypothetical protein